MSLATWPSDTGGRTICMKINQTKYIRNRSEQCSAATKQGQYNWQSVEVC